MSVVCTAFFLPGWQPMGASGVRPGLAGSLHNRLFTFGSDGQPVWELKGKEKIKNFALQTRNVVSKSHKNEEFCI